MYMSLHTTTARKYGGGFGMFVIIYGCNLEVHQIGVCQYTTAFQHSWSHADLTHSMHAIEFTEWVGYLVAHIFLRL